MVIKRILFLVSKKSKIKKPKTKNEWIIIRHINNVKYHIHGKEMKPVRDYMVRTYSLEKYARE